MLHKLSAVLAEFGALDVHLISQSSNNLNLTFVVDEGLGRRLVVDKQDFQCFFAENFFPVRSKIGF